MGKPEAIPQDVWDTADAVGEAIHGRHERGWVAWPLCSHTDKPAQEIVARAIVTAKAEEREACAQVADGYRDKTPNNSLRMGAGWIADDIRKRAEVNTAHKNSEG